MGTETKVNILSVIFFVLSAIYAGPALDEYWQAFKKRDWQ